MTNLICSSTDSASVIGEGSLNNNFLIRRRMRTCLHVEKSGERFAEIEREAARYRALYTVCVYVSKTLNRKILLKPLLSLVEIDGETTDLKPDKARSSSW